MRETGKETLLNNHKGSDKSSQPRSVGFLKSNKPEKVWYCIIVFKFVSNHLLIYEGSYDGMELSVQYGIFKNMEGRVKF